MMSVTRRSAELAAVARASMLRMAKAWQTVGQINQAVDAYASLVARSPNSAEAQEAADRLVALAQAYEQQGRFHLALGLYQKVERLA